MLMFGFWMLDIFFGIFGKVEKLVLVDNFMMYVVLWIVDVNN